MYVKIFLKGSVGLFQEHYFTSISETQFLKELCVVIKIYKKKQKQKQKQAQIKELQNKDEPKRKARSYFNFFKIIF